MLQTLNVFETHEALSDLNLLFFQMSNRKYNFSLMVKVTQEFADGGAFQDQIPYTAYEEALILLALVRCEMDNRVLIDFLPVFRAIFLRLCFDDWQKAMVHFFNFKELHKKGRGLKLTVAFLGSDFSFDKETKRASDFLFTDIGHDESEDAIIDDCFETQCRQLSFLILLEGQSLMDKIVDRVLENGKSNVMVNFIMFLKCVPGLAKCVPPEALFKELREAIVNKGLNLFLVRLKFGLTAQCDKVKRIQFIGKSSFGIVKDCGPLFPNSTRDFTEVAASKCAEKLSQELADIGERIKYEMYQNCANFLSKIETYFKEIDKKLASLEAKLEKMARAQNSRVTVGSRRAGSSVLKRKESLR